MIGPVAAQSMGAAFAFVNFGVPNLDSVLVVLGHFWMFRAILFLVREESFAVAAVLVSLDPPLRSSAAGYFDIYTGQGPLELTFAPA